ncbi:hypothetical protein [Arthrobacter sp. UYCo732]|uniref:hypothetical protein n=1 Tax=Arthrobacter sp. UYCo732 TaxID=3156336 RepID=UPI003394A722
MSIKVSYRTTLTCDGGGAGLCGKGSLAVFDSPTMAATIRAAVKSGWVVSDQAKCPFC